MLHAGDHANGRRTEELVQCAAKGREGFASPLFPLLHFATVYLFYRGKRLLDRSFFP